MGQTAPSATGFTPEACASQWTGTAADAATKTTQTPAVTARPGTRETTTRKENNEPPLRATNQLVERRTPQMMRKSAPMIAMMNGIVRTKRKHTKRC